jgi:hypothetical protein
MFPAPFQKFLILVVAFTALLHSPASLQAESSTSTFAAFDSDDSIPPPSARCPDGSSTSADDCHRLPTLRELTSMGARGNLIAQSRDLTLDILQGQNACSAWFQEVEPAVSEIFGSLHYELDKTGRADIFSLRDDDGETLYKDPWGAMTNENAGRDATVRINTNGAFFNRMSRVTRLSVSGVPASRDTWHFLTIASFLGDTAEARITIMLHELGHIVGRIPEDDDSWGGQSTRNTREVLRHCKGEIHFVAHRDSRPRN